MRVRAPLVRNLVLFVVVLTVARVVLWSCRSHARVDGVAWESLTMEQALAKGRSTHRRLLVEFDASWCPTCKQLNAEVLATKQGAALTSDMVAVKFDFDDEANRAVIERYVVISLPTVMVLTPEGTETGRITGYDGKDKWLKDAEAAKTSSDPLPGLRASYDAHPEDPHAAMLYGDALLGRGHPEDGLRVIERVLWMGDRSAADAAQALFTLGRYHQRVRRDPRTAQHYWRELAHRYPTSEWASGAWSWYGKAQAELGNKQLGLDAHRHHIRAVPGDLEAVAAWGSYVASQGMQADRQAALAAVRAAIDKAQGQDRKDLEEIEAKLRGSPTP